ncbi:sugar ABC transporter substrate-binding protein [Cohnella lubricantis]|uniref:Sugar ABC transporter substrate-binding protein n=1 Tax=Cohnella lubricantis TaxID=2163172 RepID=A0A841TFE9_9BACL|nr:sugar ABC transporter substrate-binding protein [Cohnella lubricantis]MBB6679046.1 sugar ABC transporter substrate-binding protein [Cohnella lubricantis]MBP2120251.1 multiple sugar transport system substrate-binding protein [Cohnella lubricantis]
MNKKLLSGTAASVLALGLLAGCGGNNSNNTSSPSPSASGSAPASSSASASPSASASGEPVNLRLYTWGTEEQYNWNHTVSAYEESHPGITVEVVTLSDKGDTQESMKKLDLAAASNETMDVIMFSDPSGYAARVALGMAAPLDDFIAADGYKVEEDYKVDTHLNGKVYALPGKFNPWYVLLNKDMLDAAGLSVPTDWTWDEFADYAKQLTKGDGADKVYGTYFHGPQAGGWMEYLKLMIENQPTNSDYLKQDGSSNLDDPNFRKTIELRVKMEKEDKSSTPYEDMISQKLAYRTQFFNQKAAMLPIGSWMNTEIGGTETVPLTFHVAVAPFPKNNASDPTGYTPVTTDYVAVAESSKHKQEAYDFIRWYTTEGQLVQGKNVPSWNQITGDQLEPIIDTILSGTKNPELVDKKSLVDTLTVSKASAIITPASYQSEVYKAVNEEYEKLILGNQDIDTMIANSQKRVQEIIDSNKK